MKRSSGAFLKRFGADIRNLRLKRGLSGRELARRAKVPVRSILALERGRRDVSLRFIHRLVAALDLPKGGGRGETAERSARERHLPSGNPTGNKPHL